MLLIAILGGCESKTDNSQAQAEAPTTTQTAATPEPKPKAATNIPADTYAPGGLDGATVMLKPAGKALISVVAGYPARIYEGAADGEYRQARLMPGDYILNVGNVDARQGLNLSFRGEAGDYYALALTYAIDGKLFWTPVIVAGAPNGPIVADKDGMLVGKTQADAIKLLIASAANKTAPEPQAAKAAETKIKALFQKATKAYEANKMEEALQALDEALMIAPSFDSALVLRGAALGRLKKPKSALESLDKAIRIGRNNRGANDAWLAWPFLEKGVVLMAARKPELAHEALGESIRVKPTIKALTARANLSFAQGQALGKKGDWDGAEPFFKRAQADANKGIELAPKSVGLWTLKTGTHMMLNQHEQACSAMRKACELGNCSILKQSPQCKPD